MLVFLSLLFFTQSYAYLIYFRYFAQNSTGSCERCHKSCKECMGPRPTDCLSCNTYFYLLHSTNECVSYCPQYYYENKDNNICERCHSSCLTCEGKSMCSALSKKWSHQNTWNLGCKIWEHFMKILTTYSATNLSMTLATVGDADISQGLVSFSRLLATCCTHWSIDLFLLH